MKRIGFRTAQPLVVLPTTRFLTRLSTTSIFESASFRLPNIAFIELIEALEASLLALSTIVFAFRAS
jgi:hypothetical protein